MALSPVRSTEATLWDYLDDMHALGFEIFEDGYYDKVDVAHAAGSFHYDHNPRTGRGHAGDVNWPRAGEERAKILSVALPEARRRGLAVTYSQHAHVPNHDDHLHVDIGTYSNIGYGAQILPGTGHDGGSNVHRPDTVVNAGDSGSAVKRVQRAVGAKADGEFGSKTAADVKRVQKILGVKADGKWGPATQKAYEKFCDGDLGSKTIRLWQEVMGTKVDGKISKPRSSLVLAVQKALHFTGHYLDGELGPLTWKMIQRHLGQHEDGIPGEQTITALQKRLLSGKF